VMVLVPAVTPVTTPVLETTVATPVALLDHVPDDVASLRVVDPAPMHALRFPAIAAGDGLTEAVTVLAQPVGNV